MSDSEFQAVANKVYTLTGIVLPEHKRALAISRLSKRLASRGFDNFSDYASFLNTPEGEAENNKMINAITTNLTSFFRESHHFEDLVKTLTKIDRNQDNEKHSFINEIVAPSRKRIWSAACSTGEEPYSIAFSLIHAGLAPPGADIRILATDIDDQILETARRGVFPAEKLAACPPEIRQKYFEPMSNGTKKVLPTARNLIDFNHLNLHKPWPMKGKFDAIFCRNVLIYFDAAAKRDIVARMISILRPGGTLYLGHSESVLGNHEDLIQDGRTTFRKRR